MAVTGKVTVESCTAACQSGGYRYAGMEYSAECCESLHCLSLHFMLIGKRADCGWTLDQGSGPTPISDCGMTCAGNSSEYCGGPNRLSLYNYTGILTVEPPEGKAEDPPVSLVNVQSGLLGSWAYVGCYVDNANGRVLGNELDSTTMTVQSCVANCNSNNFSVAGIEYSTQCCKS